MLGAADSLGFPVGEELVCAFDTDGVPGGNDGVLGLADDTWIENEGGNVDSLGLIIGIPDTLGFPEGKADSALVGDDKMVGLSLGVRLGRAVGDADTLRFPEGEELPVGAFDSEGASESSDDVLGLTEVAVLGDAKGAVDSLGPALGIADTLGVPVGEVEGTVLGDDERVGVSLGVWLGRAVGDADTLGFPEGEELPVGTFDNEGAPEGNDDVLGGIDGAVLGNVEGAVDSLGLALTLGVRLGDSLGLADIEGAGDIVGARVDSVTEVTASMLS